MSATEGLAKHRGSFISRYRSIPFEWQDDTLTYNIQSTTGFLEYRQELSLDEDSLINQDDLFVFTIKIKPCERELWETRRRGRGAELGFPFYVREFLLLDSEVNLQSDTLLIPINRGIKTSKLQNNLDDSLGYLVFVKEGELSPSDSFFHLSHARMKRVARKRFSSGFLLPYCKHSDNYNC